MLASALNAKWRLVTGLLGLPPIVLTVLNRIRKIERPQSLRRSLCYGQMYGRLDSTMTPSFSFKLLLKQRSPKTERELLLDALERRLKSEAPDARDITVP
jgi:hypothetical protein